MNISGGFIIKWQAAINTTPNIARLVICVPKSKLEKSILDDISPKPLYQLTKAAYTIPINTSSTSMLKNVVKKFWKNLFVSSPTRQAKNTGDIAVIAASSKFITNNLIITLMRKTSKGMNNRNITTPVIMMTANALSGMREEYLDKGFADYVSKPVEIRELLSTVGRHLPDDRKKPL